MIYAEVDSGGWIVQFLEQDVMPTWGENGFLPLSEPIPWGGGPTQRLAWNAGVPQWIETASLTELRVRKNAEINAAHELANRTSFTFAGTEIQANEHSMVQIQMTDAGIRRRGALRLDWQGAWKTLDNGYVLIPDVATWDLFMDAIEVTGAANFAKAQDLKQQVAAAQSEAAILSITWDSTEA
jgi:hypothetical protein